MWLRSIWRSAKISGNTNRPSDGAHGFADHFVGIEKTLTVADLNPRLTQFVNDPLRPMPLVAHNPASKNHTRIQSQELDQFLGERISVASDGRSWHSRKDRMGWTLCRVGRKQAVRTASQPRHDCDPTAILKAR